MHMLTRRDERYEQKFISLYFLADLQYTVYISVFWIKQAKGECRHILSAKRGSNHITL